MMWRIKKTWHRALYRGKGEPMERHHVQQCTKVSFCHVSRPQLSIAANYQRPMEK